MHCWLAGSQFTLQSRKSNFIRFEYYYVNKQEGFSCPYTRRIAARLQNCCCCCFTTPRRHTHRPSSSRRVAWWSLHRNKLLAGENEKLLSSPGTKDKLSSVGSCLPTLVGTRRWYFTHCHFWLCGTAKEQELWAVLWWVRCGYVVCSCLP